ncbi:MAG TPA: hypothetical protein VK807_23295 [Gemmatimonadaceae bacterium]|jgi:hypothetical protein|nr:hypothetical protein [Gemmatimonadaceae bacterium]
MTSVAPIDAVTELPLPGPTDRAAIMGQTGTGKTTLGRVIIETRPYAVVHDPKHRVDWGPRWPVYTSLSRLFKSESPWLVYRPSWAELHDPVACDEFFEWTYVSENRTLMVDEVRLIANGDNYPPHYGVDLMQGRQSNVSVLSCTQRPSRVPQIMMSESEHAYVFRLVLMRDRQRIEEEWGLDRERIRRLQKHEFFYCPQDGEPVGPLILNLRSNT